MQKPNTLRAEIEQQLPELAQNPDKLSMNITQGKIIANKGSLSHTTEYTLNILITDFTSDIEILKTTIIHWAQTHQPDILGAGSTPNQRTFNFEADILSNQSYDILIELPLTERTLAQSNEHNKIQISHPRNANHSDLLTALGTAHPIP